MTKEKKNYLLLAVFVFALGIFIIGLVSHSLGDKKITLKEMARINVGMTYEEVTDIVGSESSQELVKIDGAPGTAYTWVVYAGDNRYDLSAACVDGEVVRIEQALSDR